MKKTFWFAALFAAVVNLPAADYSVSCRINSPKMDGVVICDGEKFYTPDASGKCEINFTAAESAFVYVLTPSDLKVKGDYSHALKPGKSAVTFTLEPQTVPETFKFLHGADVQYNFATFKVQLYNDMKEIQQIADEHDCAFIMFPGDMTEFGDAAQMQLLKGGLDSTPMRKYNIWGGHDGLKSRPSQLKNFTEIIGAPYFSWNYGNVHFIAPISETGRLTPMELTKQYNWISNDLSRLAPGTPVAVVTHIPFYLTERIGRIIKDKKLRLIGYFGAHIHYSNVHYCDGIPFIYNSTLRWTDDGTFTKKVRIITCSAKDGIIRTATRVLNHARRIHAVAAGRHLTVFVYDAVHDPSAVSCTINGTEVALQRKGEYIWETVLGSDLPAGRLNVSVKSANASWKKSVSVSAPANLKWSYASGSSFHRFPAPVVYGDVLYLGLSAPDKNNGGGGVLALNRHTGEKIYSVLEGIDFTGGVVTDGSKLFALSNDGELYTLNAADGTLLNKFKLINHGKTRDFGWWQHASVPMQVHDGKVLVYYQQNSNGTLYCFDIATGKPLWDSPVEFGVSEKAGSFRAHEDKIYFTGSYRVGALDLKTGKELWKHMEKTISSSSVRPLICGDFVYYYMRASVWKVDRHTGKVIWFNKKRIPGSVNKIGGLVPVGNGKLLGFATNAVILLDDATGEFITRSNIPALPVSDGVKFHYINNTSQPVMVNGKVVLSADDGKVYTVAPGTVNFVPMLVTGSAFKGFPEVVGNMYYTVAADGNIYALEIK